MSKTYLTRRDTSPNFYFRRRVPDRLRASFGKREIFFSLHTSDPRTAERLVRQHAVDTDAQLLLHEQLVRNQQNPQPEETASLSRALEPHHIPTLAERYRETLVATHLEHPPTRAELADMRTWYSQLETELTDATVLGDTSFVEDAGQAHLAAEGFNPALTAPATLHLYYQRLLHADLIAIRQQLQHLSGAPIDKPKVRPSPLEGDNWEAMLECWKAERAPGDKTWDEANRLVNRFRTFSNDLSPLDITTELVEAFRDSLLQEGLSRQRVKTILSLLRPVVATAIEMKRCSLTTNPFADVKINVPKRAAGKEQRQPFELEHLQALFHSPVYTDGQRPKKGGGDAAFWLPLMGLFGGPRAEELGQLRLADVLRRDGQLYVRITELGEDQELKTLASERMVPVHEELLRIGFENYVETMRERGEQRLFPELKADRYGNYTKMFSTWCNEYIDTYVVDDKRYAYHSFRHCFEEFAGWSGLTQYQIDGILGHSPQGMAKLYGKKSGSRRTFNPKVLAEGMAKYHVEGLDLSHLYGSY
ncbi:phage integrase SAM-like domain-containing protein [Ralstonia wenshanensis]|uniref:site-specific integrase n=1 Tax=Ralstonia wenshanensis TaxID=2842456 RepID=UPI001E572DED|nr:site-specific integrase [Ralstonia wenshanensis]UGS91512.1 phage integrase SAM-like domain-containing protein [Ralstonia wenshanensis]